MSTLQWRRHFLGRKSGCPVDELLLDSAAPLVLQRADCCVAPAVFRAVLPPTDERQRSAALLLCGHHYRGCRDALRAKGASVYDLGNRLVASTAAAE